MSHHIYVIINMFDPTNHRPNKKRKYWGNGVFFFYHGEMHHHLSCRHGIGSDLWFFCGFPDSEFGGLWEKERMKERGWGREGQWFCSTSTGKSFESIKISWSTFVTQDIKGIAVIIVLNIRYAVHIWSYSTSLDKIIVNNKCNLHEIFHNRMWIFPEAYT